MKLKVTLPLTIWLPKLFELFKHYGLLIWYNGLSCSQVHNMSQLVKNIWPIPNWALNSKPGISKDNVDKFLCCSTSFLCSDYGSLKPTGTFLLNQKPDNKYFRLILSSCLCHNYSAFGCSEKATEDNRYMSGHGCV